MNIAPLDHIPPLQIRSFLAILQSITQTHIGKNAPLSLPAVNVSNFAEKTWKECQCSSADINAIAQSFTDMFSVPLTAPTPHDAVGNFADDVFRIWQRGAQTVTFFTSGSTGKPKPCTHPEDHLRQELTGILPLLGTRTRALVTVPLHHLYGFTFGLLLPQALNAPIVSEAPLPPAVLHQMQAGDMVVGIPLLWSRIAQILQEKAALGNAENNAASRGIMLLSGTAPLPPETFATMLSHGFTMIEFFGSSEMGVMCRRLEPNIPFTLLPQFTRVHDSEESNTAQDAQTNAVPDSVLRTLPNGSTQLFPLQDCIQWIDERHLNPKGRKDFAVQVGGVNVFPARVAQVMAKHPAIAACSVRLMRPEEGDRLKAFVVPKDGVDTGTLKKDLRAFAKQQLSPEEQPTRYDFGTDLPRNLVGKPSDW